MVTTKIICREFGISRQAVHYWKKKGFIKPLKKVGTACLWGKRTWDFLSKTYSERNEK